MNVTQKQITNLKETSYLSLDGLSVKIIFLQTICHISSESSWPVKVVFLLDLSTSVSLKFYSWSVI